MLTVSVCLGTTFWEPWSYWRTVTLLLASIWLVSAVVRLAQFHGRWERRLEEFGASRRWMRKQLALVILRVTILDPTNLALLLFITGVWSVRRLLL